MEIRVIRRVWKLQVLILVAVVGGLIPLIGSAESLELDVRTKDFAPFAFEENGKWEGFSLDLWDAIASELGATYTLKSEDSISTLLDAVSSKKADVAVAGITVTAEREGTVDFTHPFYESGLQVLTRRSGDGPSLFHIVESSGLLDVLILLFLSMLLIAHLVWIAERMNGGEHFSQSYGRGIWDAFWWAAVTVTTVGYGDKVPKGDAGRMLALLWMFTGLILVSFFTASVTTALTLERLEGTISGPDDLRGKRVASPRGSTSALAVTGLGGLLEEEDTISECFDLLDENVVDAVVYDSPVLQYYASREGAGEMVVVGPVFQRESYGIALQEGSPLRERINTVLLNFRENGTYRGLHEKWFGTGE